MATRQNGGGAPCAVLLLCLPLACACGGRPAPLTPSPLATPTPSEAGPSFNRTYGEYVYVTTEAKTGLDIVDMRDPDHPRKVRTWDDTLTSAHTLWIDDERGLLFANGYYDTYSGTSTGFNGAWGAYIFPGSDLILASDINGGLFVIGYTGP